MDHHSSWHVRQPTDPSLKSCLRKKHDHVDLVMSNGKVLRYKSPAALAHGCGPKNWKDIAYWHLGPEPLSEAFNAEYLKASVRKKNPD